MDEMSVGVVDAPVNAGGAAVKTAPESSQGTESAASEQGTEQAGDSQESAEGGSADQQTGRQRGPSKLDTIRELRGKLRDQRTHWESEIGGLRAEMEELKRASQSGRAEGKPSKTFWEDPEGALATHLSELEKRMLTKFQESRTQEQEASRRGQEMSEAAKFIRSQKGMTDDDVQDIREILLSHPKIALLDPLDQAKYALSLWREERGIGDKSEAKARAAAVVGAAGSTSSGPKTWTEPEMQAEIEKLPADPKTWTEDQKKRFDYLDAEFKNAYNQGRVKK